MRGPPWRETIGCVDVRFAGGRGSAGTDDSVGRGCCTGGLGLGGGAAKVGATASAAGAVAVAGPPEAVARAGAVWTVAVMRGAGAGGTGGGTGFAVGAGGGTGFAVGGGGVRAPGTLFFAAPAGAGKDGAGLAFNGWDKLGAGLCA